MLRGPVLASLATILTAATVLAAPQISLTQLVEDGKGGVTTLEAARSVAVSSPDGAFVYVVAATDNSLTVFSRSPMTGRLTLVEAEVNDSGGLSGFFTPEVVAVGPGGAQVYAAAKQNIFVFSRDGITGEVTFDSMVVYPDRASAIAFSPDGAHAYVTTDLPGPDAELTVYARDGLTGALTLVQQISDNQGGVDGIERATSVAVSPDEKHVYVTGFFDDAVAAFERDLVTGELTFLQQYVDGTGGIDGIHRPQAVAVSPDGAQVYVGGNDRGLVQFDRDAGTGLLTFVEQAATGYDVQSLAMDPTGTSIFTGSNSGEPDRVALLARNPGTGAVTFASAETLDGNRGVAISPDGTTGYATSGTGVGVFRVIFAACTASPMGGCALPSAPLKAAATVKDSIDDDQDKLTWKWTKGAALAIADFGDPINQPDDVVACVYDASVNPQPVLEALIPALGVCRSRPCWKTNSAGTTLKYKDSLLLPTGVSGFSAKAGAAGLSSIKLKAKGDALATPTLPLTTPVRVQVQAPNGNCWEAVYSTAIHNDIGQFRAKSD